MYLVVGGTRGYFDQYLAFLKFVKDVEHLAREEVTHIVHGECPDSPDMLAKRLAREWRSQGRVVGYTSMPAQWARYARDHGRNPAGQIRNEEMARLCNFCCAQGGFALLFWDRRSTGTRGMIRYALKHRLRGFVVTLRGKDDWHAIPINNTIWTILPGLGSPPT